MRSARGGYMKELVADSYSWLRVFNPCFVKIVNFVRQAAAKDPICLMAVTMNNSIQIIPVTKFKSCQSQT